MIDQRVELPKTGMAAEPTVYCVVVNRNGWSDSLACLDALAMQSYSHLTVIAVDNGSTDDSVARLRAAYADLILIELPTNKPLVLREEIMPELDWQSNLKADYVWLLNNDTVAPPETTTQLVDKIRTSAGVGIVGSVLYYLDEPHKIQAWGGGHINRFLAYSTHFHHPVTLGRDDFLTFASVLVSRDVLLSVGLLHEGYFMYYEDADYCLRARNAGFSLAVAKDTSILHKRGRQRQKGNS